MSQKEAAIFHLFFCTVIFMYYLPFLKISELFYGMFIFFFSVLKKA
jgi:hypothetical protein